MTAWADMVICTGYEPFDDCGHPHEYSSIMYAYRDATLGYNPMTGRRQPCSPELRDSLARWYVIGCFANFYLHMREVQKQKEAWE